MSQTEGATTAEQNPVETNGSAEASESTGGKTKAVAVAAGAGAAVAGIAGGFVVAARDTRRRVLGVPVGKRTRMQQTAVRRSRYAAARARPDDSEAARRNRRAADPLARDSHLREPGL